MIDLDILESGSVGADWRWLVVFNLFCSDSMWWMWLGVESVGSCMFERPPDERVERRTFLALRQVSCLEARRQASHPKVLKTIPIPSGIHILNLIPSDVEILIVVT